MTISDNRSRIVESPVLGAVFLLVNYAVRLVIISKFWCEVLLGIGIKLFSPKRGRSAVLNRLI